MNENTVKTKNFTIKELQATLNNDGFDYLSTSSLVKFLVVLGIAKEVGKQKMPEGQRGKPSTIYEIPQIVELQFFANEEDAGVEIPEGTPPEIVAEVGMPLDKEENKDNTVNVENVPVEVKAESPVMES